MKSIDYKKYYKLLYYRALYYLNNEDISRDIASQTITKFILHKKQIKKELVKPWLLKTCKNLSLEYIRKNSSQIGVNEFNDSILYQEYKESQIERDTELENAFKNALEILTDKESNLLYLYLLNNKDIKKLTDILDFNYNSIKKRIYKIKGKLKAETFRRLGYVSTKKLISPQLNDRLLKFLKSFKKNLENKTLHKMKYYFSRTDLENYNPDFQILEVKEYEVEYKNGIFKILVMYKNKKGRIDGFFLEFKITKKNSFRIVSPPRKASGIKHFPVNSKRGKKLSALLKAYPENRRGIHKIPKSEYEKLLKESE